VLNGSNAFYSTTWTFYEITEWVFQHNNYTSLIEKGASANQRKTRTAHAVFTKRDQPR